MKQGKFPSHLKVTWTESCWTMCKSCTTGKSKVALFLKCIFTPQNTGKVHTTPQRNLCQGLIIQQSFPNLSIYLCMFMNFIAIINIGISIFQRHQVIRDWWEKRRHLGTEWEQKVSKLTFPTMKKKKTPNLCCILELTQLEYALELWLLICLFPKIAGVHKTTAWLTD